MRARIIKINKVNMISPFNIYENWEGLENKSIGEIGEVCRVSDDPREDEYEIFIVDLPQLGKGVVGTFSIEELEFLK